MDRTQTLSMDKDPLCDIEARVRLDMALMTQSVVLSWLLPAFLID